MLMIDDLIERFDGSVAHSTNSKEICQYIADLLKELKERRKADSCEGCVNESEKSSLLVCYTCRRHYHYADLYKPEMKGELNE